MCLISSTLLSHEITVGGDVDFHRSGMQALAASSKCLITDVLYVFSGMFDA